MTYLEVSEWVSLSLTAGLLVLAAEVIRIYWAPLKSYFNKDKTPSTILMAGICISMLSDFLDNTYWSIPWGLKYIDSPLTNFWMSHGVIANIPFRQILTLIGLFLHMKADSMQSGKSKRFKRILSIAAGCSIITAVGLLFV